MFRLPFRRPTDPSPDEDAALTRALRAEYTAPRDEAYWDSLEARVMAAVRQGAGRVAERAAAPLEWWQALAGWGRPGLIAAGVVLFFTGVVSSRVSHGDGGSFRDLVGAPTAGGATDEPDLARVLDAPTADSAAAAQAQAERDAAYLLSDGLERRRSLHLDSLDGPGAAAERRTRAEAHATPGALRRAQREATFRFVLPEE
ncbi:MAG TPA: hypothetical protein VEZ47_06905 [Gemmatirosa sp.]|nr:hypothetical protein [Gemmatirosa sp.]